MPPLHFGLNEFFPEELGPSGRSLRPRPAIGRSRELLERSCDRAIWIGREYRHPTARRAYDLTVERDTAGEVQGHIQESIRRRQQALIDGTRVVVALKLRKR